MGVGYPVDLVVCVALGVDMFDCVYPCRTARFGTALVEDGTMKLKSSQFSTDFNPIDEHVKCFVNTKYTRSYIHSLVNKEPTGCNLISYHNIAYQMNLMKDIRKAIKEGYFPKFVQNFMDEHYPKKDYPKWAVNALDSAGIKLQ